eukprot:TRINITY_DN1010_c0_g1_i2.p1 TRINITY_DN1010_c0_g1~~TRINITY_DN1010_c0_g1_i2.p1  ORF type:complete len:334 (+),score=97.75 TRINITY_DN1010_c0_g1_i2:102-1103(+)
MSRKSSVGMKNDSRRGSLLAGDLPIPEQSSSRRSSILENTIFSKILRKQSNASQLSLNSNLTEELNLEHEDDKYTNKAYDVSLLAGYLEEEIKHNFPEHECPTHVSKTFTHWFTSAQKEGAAHAKFVLGAYYQFGFRDMPADHLAALKLYVLAAKEGDIRAVNNIGVMLCHGEGLGVVDEVRGQQWLEIAAEAGDENSRMNLSILKTVSNEVAHRNVEEAFTILWNLADSHPSKQVFNNLACMYCRGFGVEQNYSNALDWFMRASEAGSKVAEYNLGVMYLNGMGVKADVKEANYWFKSAKNDLSHEDYKCVAAAKDPTKLLMLTTMTYYIPK